MKVKSCKLRCPVCNKHFWVYPHYKNIQKTCSRSCANTFRALKIPRRKCNFCNIIVYRPITHYKKHVFCSKKCEGLYRRQRIIKKCKVCKKKFELTPAKIKQTFCSRKCMGIGNRHKHIHKKPQYRSFGECTMFVLLKKNFKHTIIASDKQQLYGYEIDIWIPKLKTGIEYNGPHHFKPIYGQRIFKNTKKSDKIKRILAKRRGIKIINLNVLENISSSTKTRLINIFKQLCRKLKLKPKQFNFSKEEILKEKFRKLSKAGYIRWKNIPCQR